MIRLQVMPGRAHDRGLRQLRTVRPGRAARVLTASSAGNGQEEGQGPPWPLRASCAWRGALIEAAADSCSGVLAWIGGSSALIRAGRGP